MTAGLTFLDGAPEGTDRVLCAIAAAESLTDEVARKIYDLVPLDEVSADQFIRMLHYVDFVEPRNSEWSFTPIVRQRLLELHSLDEATLHEVHRVLMRYSIEGDPALAGSVIPSYLFTSAGRAYHSAALGNLQEALSYYAQAVRGRLSGAQWLASKFAWEQENQGLIPPGNIETTFLRAMVLYREGQRRDAEPLFRQVARTDETRIEVAVSLHILGNMVGRANPREAEAYFRRSIAIGEQIGNRHHVAQTLHSLANLIGRVPSRRDEAEDLYKRSLAILERIGDQRGVAQTLHSLANLIGRAPSRRDEAEELYKRSLAILERIGDQRGVAQTLHSLANLIGRAPSRRDEAEELYKRSLAIGEEIGDQHGIAQRLHSLANLIGRAPSRRDEAEDLYKRSLAIDEQIGNQRGVAQTLHSLANLLSRLPNRRDEAEDLYKHSLAILERIGDQRGVAQTLRSYSFVIEHRSPQEAERLLERSLALNERIGDRRGVQLVRDSLRKLRDRHGL